MHSLQCRQTLVAGTMLLSWTIEDQVRLHRLGGDGVLVIALEKMVLRSHCSFGLMSDIAEMLPTIGLTTAGQP